MQCNVVSCYSMIWFVLLCVYVYVYVYVHVYVCMRM